MLHCYTSHPLIKQSKLAAFEEIRSISRKKWKYLTHRDKVSQRFNHKSEAQVSTILILFELEEIEIMFPS